MNPDLTCTTWPAPTRRCGSARIAGRSTWPWPTGAVGRHGAVAFHGQGRDRVLRPEAGAGAAARRQAVSDSWRIACHLEDAFPDRPSLFGGEAGAAEPVRQQLERRHAGAHPGPAAAVHPRADPREGPRLLPRHARKRFGPLEELPAGYAAQIEALRAALQPLRLTLARQPYRPATRRPMPTTRCSGCSCGRAAPARRNCWRRTTPSMPGANGCWTRTAAWPAPRRRPPLRLERKPPDPTPPGSRS